jgi:hypothetical protein
MIALSILHFVLGFFAAVFVYVKCDEAGKSDAFTVLLTLLAFLFWPLVLLYAAIDFVASWFTGGD